MNSKLPVVLIVVLCMLLLTALQPRRADAGIDDTVVQSLIISGAVIGVVTIISVIAILGAGDEPRFLTSGSSNVGMALKRSPDQLRWGTQCAPVEGNLTLLCW